MSSRKRTNSPVDILYTLMNSLIEKTADLADDKYLNLIEDRNQLIQDYNELDADYQNLKKSHTSDLVKHAKSYSVLLKEKENIRHEYNKISKERDDFMRLYKHEKEYKNGYYILLLSFLYILIRHYSY